MSTDSPYTPDEMEKLLSCDNTMKDILDPVEYESIIDRLMIFIRFARLGGNIHMGIGHEKNGIDYCEKCRTYTVDDSQNLEKCLC